MLQLPCFLVGFKVWTDLVPEAQPNALTAALRKSRETARVSLLFYFPELSWQILHQRQLARGAVGPTPYVVIIIWLGSGIQSPLIRDAMFSSPNQQDARCRTAA